MNRNFREKRGSFSARICIAQPLKRDRSRETVRARLSQIVAENISPVRLSLFDHRAGRLLGGLRRWGGWKELQGFDQLAIGAGHALEHWLFDGDGNGYAVPTLGRRQIIVP